MRNDKGQFIKGHSEGIRFGLGQSTGSKEKYKKISEAQIGKYVSEETRKRLSDSHKGKKTWNKGTKGKVKPNSGSFGPRDTSRENNVNWKGGIAKESDMIRHSIEGNLWRNSVFARDGYTCQKTKIKGGSLVAHHILNFSSHPELRFAIDNGITLSDKAHKEFHRKYGNRNNNREQLDEFLQNC